MNSLRTSWREKERHPESLNWIQSFLKKKMYFCAELIDIGQVFQIIFIKCNFGRAYSFVTKDFRIKQNIVLNLKGTVSPD